MDQNKAEKRIMESEELSEKQRETLKRYIRELKIEGIKVRTRVEYLRILKELGKSIKKPYEEANREDIANYLEGKLDLLVSSSTRLKSCLKRFYKTMSGGEEYPSCVKWLKTSIRKHDLPVKEATELWTEKEILELIKRAGSVRNKAIISSLYESAARADELLKLKVKSLRFDDDGCRMHLSGKTGTRSILLTNSVIYLKNWLEIHPYKDDMECPFWVSSISGGREGIKHNALWKILRKARDMCPGSLSKKKIRPHLLRHSRLTHLAKVLPEYKLKYFAGWGMDSGMSAIYVHLSGADLDEDIMAINNKTPKKPKPSVLLPRICPRCQKENAPDSLYCKVCGQVLDPKTALELEDQKDWLLKKLLGMPDVQKLLGAVKKGKKVLIELDRD